MSSIGTKDAPRSSVYSHSDTDEPSDHHRHEPPHQTPMEHYLANSFDEVVTPRTSYLSPDGETPRRILSSQSLVGEDINTECMESSNATRKSATTPTDGSDLQQLMMDVELSPFTPTTPGEYDDDDDYDDDDLVIGDGIKVDDDDDATTPPSSVQGPFASLSPPLLTTYTPSSTGRSVERGDECLGPSSRPHPPSQPHLPQRRRTAYPLLHASNATSSNTANNINIIIDSSATQASAASTGRPPARPPRAPQSSPLVTAPFARSVEGRPSTSAVSQHQQPQETPAAPPASTGGPAAGGGHARTHTDNTNFTFLSALTDATAEFAAPKRRTLSWDNNETAASHPHQHAIARKHGRRSRVAAAAEAVVEHGSPGGSSIPGGILQPILTEDDLAPVAPPASIWASTLRRATPGTPPHPSAHPRQSAGRGSVGGGKVDNDDRNPSSFQSITSEPRDRSDLGRSLDPGDGRDFHQIGGLVDGEERVANSTPFLGRDEKKESSDRARGSPGAMDRHLGGEVPLDAAEDRPAIGAPGAVDDQQVRCYSLCDILDATIEATVETDVVKAVDSSMLLRDTRNVHASLFPRIPDDRVHDFEHEDTEHQPMYVKTKIICTIAEERFGLEFEDCNVGTMGIFAQLTMKLREANSGHVMAETIHVKENPEAESRCNTARNYRDTGQRRPMRNSATPPQSGVATDIERRCFSEIWGNACTNSLQIRNLVERLDSSFRILRGKADDSASFSFGYFNPFESKLWHVFMKAVWYLVLPCIFAASLCFYVFETLPTGRSWWVIIQGCREIVTFFVARYSENIVIDFLTFRTRTFLKFFGSALSLAVVQSKGWPYLLVAWGLVDLILLLMFNEGKPNGNVTEPSFYRRCIYICVGLGVATTVKRTLLGMFVGKRLVVNYRDGLSTAMKKLLLLSEVASLSVRIMEDTASQQIMMLRHDLVGTRCVEPLKKPSTDEDVVLPAPGFEYSEGLKFNSRKAKKAEKSSSSLEQNLADRLQEWEEPEQRLEDNSEVSARDVLQFRRAFDSINNEYPFSPSFGRANTREECVEAAQTVYDRLARGNSNGMLNFDVLCRIAKLRDGSTDRSKIRELVKVFRPCRKGMISKLDFVRSTDSVYKTLRLLMANMSNSCQMDRSYEKLVNIVYFSGASFIVLAVLGVDFHALLIALAGLFVTLNVISGSTKAKYVEGILFIMIQKPYDIGDRICFKSQTDPVDEYGPAHGGWIVEKVDLYTTTVRSGTTREFMTLGNGSLADSRIVNLRRSDRANVTLHLKFTIDVTEQQLNVFRRRIAGFMKDRPREWIKLNEFRCRRVENELQYIEYTVNIQHREAWQNYPAVQQSRSELLIFALDLQKALKMKYTTPPATFDLQGFGHVSVETGTPPMRRVVDYGCDDPDSISSEHPLPNTEGKKSREER